MDSCHLSLPEHASGNDQIGQGEEAVKLGEIFPSPQYRTFPYPKRFLIMWQGCSTWERTWAFRCSHSRVGVEPSSLLHGGDAWSG